MSDRRLPVRPDLTQLKHQAKDLLRAIRRGDAAALAELQEHHPTPPEPARAKVADAQLTLARSYQASSWPRLVQACNLIDAIWEDDVATVCNLVSENPALLQENAGIRNNNWGPPLSYAANLGRDRIIEALYELGATDLQKGLDRAILQSRIATARKLHVMLGSPRPPRGALGSPAYTLSVEGTALLFEFGVEMLDEQGNPDAPVDVVLESDSRKPDAKHQILEMYAAHGFALPDTPMMAPHRGRIDLLEKHLYSDPSLLKRTFSYAEIFPPALKCTNEQLPRTTLVGATLLHVCVEFDELEIARWLLDRGAPADVPAAIDANGFGGHTPLFAAVVSYPNFWMNYTGGWAHSRKPKAALFAQLLLDRGANPNARASLRDKARTEKGEGICEHRNLTPIGWGKVFHDKIVVSEPAMQLIAERGGKE
jgi:hypothetical protein